MDLLEKIEMFIGESVIAHSTEQLIKRTTDKSRLKAIKKSLGVMVKNFNILDTEYERLLKQVEDKLDEGKDFPTKKKSDDKSSQEVSDDAEKKLTDLEKAEDAQDDEGSMSPEEIKAKEKKQKELKKKAERETRYTPPYSAS